ncbi:MAG: HAD-IIA family hydrolase [Magnetococcales bacterium]|nr:HAD-IIA family hydrolase [Magnetococcales bacterium]
MHEKPTITHSSQLIKSVEQYRQKLCSLNGKLGKVLTSGSMERIDFSKLVDRFELIIFDAYGVLNRGSAAVPGAVAAVNRCRQKGIDLLIVSNNASEKPEMVLEKLRRLGFLLDAKEIITSGMAVKPYLKNSPYQDQPYLLIGTPDSASSYCAEPERLLLNPPGSSMLKAGTPAYILICSNRDYYGREQEQVVESWLKKGPLPLLLANPDIVVQDSSGEQVVVAGFTAQELADNYFCPIEGIGKPFSSVYELALKGFSGVDPKEVLMVGDSLTTDILGGAAMGFTTCLTLSGIHGKEPETIEAQCMELAIRPDYIVTSIGS